VDYIKIVNWKRWQSYRKDRPDWRPTWIKLHRVLLRNPEWVNLSDAERGQLVCIWLLAADFEGRVPADPHMVASLCYLDEEPDFQTFQDLGFIEGWVTPANQTEPLANQTEPVVAQNRIEENRLRKKDPPYTPPLPTKRNQLARDNGFDEFWLAYPRKVGKGAARRCWKRIRPDAELKQKILNSLASHTYSHDWSRDYGRFIPHPATFLNQERWDDELTEPPDPSVESGEFSSPESHQEYNEALNARLSQEAEKGEELSRKHRMEDEEE